MLTNVCQTLGKLSGVFIAVGVALSTASVHAAEQKSPPGPPATVDVVVKQGDTLVGLGEQLLTQPWRWMQVQKLNRVADPYHLKPGSVLRIPASFLRPVPLNASIESVVGEADSSRGKPVAGMQLAANDTVSTAAASYVTLRLPDASRLVVQPESRLRIEQLQRLQGSDAQQSRVEVPEGRVESKVSPQRGPGARYEIRTPTAIIGVRGTEFRTAFDAAQQRARVEVTEGVVESNAKTRVAAGNGAVVDAQGTRTAALPAAPSLEKVPKLFERPLLRLPLPVPADSGANAMAEAAAYRLIVADARGFTQPLFETTGSGRELRVPGLEDGDYQYRLRAITQEGLEGMDAEGAFRLKARPEPPFVSQPVPNSKTSGEEVEFKWSEQTQADRYRVQIAGEAGFAEPVAQAEDLRTTQYKARLEPGVYQWRLASVRADGDRGPWGDPVKFTLKPLQGPPEPPAIGSDEVSFTWSGEPGQRFKLQMAKDTAFSQLVVERETSEATLVLPRPSAGVYFVRVQATDPDGYVAPWSSAQRFEVPYSKAWWLLLLVPLTVL